MSTNELLSVDLKDCEASATRINEDDSVDRFAPDPIGSLSTRVVGLSSWSSSLAKRMFDVSCVLCALPLLLPLLLLVSLAVRCSSRGPVLFLQERMGRNRRTFTILKFRTMLENASSAGPLVTTTSDQRFTPIGPFLRKWKLDEVPQLINVLMGQMSLVGPRPKVPMHEPDGLACRPGITGAASIAFAREEQTLDQIPRHELNEFYNEVVLPAKRRIDGEYMAHATFNSDFVMLVNSLLGRWDSQAMEDALDHDADPVAMKLRKPQPSAARESGRRVPLSIGGLEVSSAESDSAA